ncbi:MAG: hypothetical protein E4H03_04945 [Myxococcales bacterium]|jgi:hypothetical protein|nr:MAG: hypothetical protein E4H03_04945 [Myxococcales bacterium]
MEKLAYIVWKPADASAEEFGRVMRTEVTARLLEAGARRLSVNVADEHVTQAQAARITKFDPPIAGLVTFWLDVSTDRDAHERSLDDATERLAGYLVLGAEPIVNRTHTADLGERTPGINMVACIERPEHMTHDAWIHHWFGHHRKVACETQCSYAYVRNEVVRPLTDDAPPWAGIVEEGFPAEAVTDPMLWYKAGGSQEKLEENMGRMIESVTAFLDISRVESNPMSEYHISR